MLQFNGFTGKCAIAVGKLVSSNVLLSMILVLASLVVFMDVEGQAAVVSAAVDQEKCVDMHALLQ